MCLNNNTQFKRFMTTNLNFRMLISVRENMVLNVLSATCTNGNTITKERKATLYIRCEYLCFMNLHDGIY